MKHRVCMVLEEQCRSCDRLIKKECHGVRFSKGSFLEGKIGICKNHKPVRGVSGKLSSKSMKSEVCNKMTVWVRSDRAVLEG